MIFVIYWLLAGFVAFSIMGNYFKNMGEMAYDDSLWMLIFGGWISLLGAVLFVLKGGNIE